MFVALFSLNKTTLGIPTQTGPSQPEHQGITGPSGSGKTQILRSLAGLAARRASTWGLGAGPYYFGVHITARDFWKLEGLV